MIRAYQVAQCGDTVAIAVGSYPSQVLGHSRAGQNTDAKDCSAGADPVVFRGQAGVSLAGITIGEPWLTVTDVTTTTLTVEGWDSTVGCYVNPVAHVTFTNSVIDAGGAAINPMSMTNVQYTTLSNTTIGNVYQGETEIHASGESGCPQTDHLTFEGDTWHDFLDPNGIGSSDNIHMECLQLDALVSGTANSNVTIDSDRFENCGQYDLFVSGQMTNWTIRKTFFDTPCSHQATATNTARNNGCAVLGGALSLSQDYSTVTGRFNTFAAGTYPLFSVKEGTQSGGLWEYNIDGSFPDSIHCGRQDHWVLTGNLDSGPVTCGTDTNARRPQLVLLRTSYSQRSLRASYIVLSAEPLHLRFTVFHRRRKLLVRVASRRLDVVNGPARFRWRVPATLKTPTYLCIRGYVDTPTDGTGALACTHISDEQGLARST